MNVIADFQHRFILDLLKCQASITDELACRQQLKRPQSEAVNLVVIKVPVNPDFRSLLRGVARIEELRILVVKDLRYILNIFDAIGSETQAISDEVIVASLHFVRLKSERSEVDRRVESHSFGGALSAKMILTHMLFRDVLCRRKLDMAAQFSFALNDGLGSTLVPLVFKASARRYNCICNIRGGRIAT